MMEDWMNVMREFSRGRDKRSERGEDEQNRRGRKSKQSAPTDATGASCRRQALIPGVGVTTTTPGGNNDNDRRPPTTQLGTSPTTWVRCYFMPAAMENMVSDHVVDADADSLPLSTHVIMLCQDLLSCCSWCLVLSSDWQVRCTILSATTQPSPVAITASLSAHPYSSRPP